MKRLAAAAFMVALLASIASAVSLPVSASYLSGNRTTPSSNGLCGHGSWSGVDISWNISENCYGIWNYCYTFSDTGCASVCHMLLEVSSSITSSNYCGIIYDANCCITAPQTFTSSTSNPGLPTSLYGIELYNQPNETFDFLSTHSPMWGSFYAVDGSCQTYVWNSNIGSYPTSSSGPFTGWIPVPDTTPTSPAPLVPEPATLALLGLGLIGVLARRRSAKA